MAASPLEQFEVKPIIPIHVGGYDISFTNQALWMCIVVGAVSLFLLVAVSDRRMVPTRMQSMAELSYQFVADMIGMTSGKDGLIFFPFVFTIFMFIVTANFMGLIPGSFTVTITGVSGTFTRTASATLLISSVPSFWEAVHQIIAPPF